ncbi:MAG: hypothetical protein IJF43_08890, partial [Firmicutes bacterium]|nr:hypothetical protein [Bacillota bacterium]
NAKYKNKTDGRTKHEKQQGTPTDNLDGRTPIGFSTRLRSGEDFCGSDASYTNGMRVAGA